MLHFYSMPLALKGKGEGAGGDLGAVALIHQQKRDIVPRWH